MNLKTHQEWLQRFYKNRSWYQYSSFIRTNFLIEEVGELARIIRTIELGRDHPGEKSISKHEQKSNLTEELADILDQVLIICSKFNINAEELLDKSEDKLLQRFKQSK